MASIIRIKRSSVSGNPATLGAGELAYSALTDNGSNGGDRLYIGIGTETSGNAANHFVIGGKYFTDMLDHTPGTLTASSALIVDSNKKLDELLVDNLSLNGNTLSSSGTLYLQAGTGNTIELGSGNFIAGGAFGGSQLILDSGVAAVKQLRGGDVSLTVGAEGTATSSLVFNNDGSLTVPGTIKTLSNGNLTLAPNGTGKLVLNNPYIGGDSVTLAEYIYDTVGGAVTGGTGITVTNDDGANTSTIRITDTTVTGAGTPVGSSTSIPVITYNAQGQLTAVSTASISTSLGIAGDTGTDTIALATDTLTFTGGTGITSAVNSSTNTVTFDIDNTVATLDGTQTLTNKTLTLPTIGGTGAVFSGSTSGTTTVLATATAGTTTLTLPAATDTLVGKATTDTLTNKTISGSSNTLSNIGNGSLTNSAVTIGSTSVSLGATVTTFAGLASVTSTAFVGALTGNASTATTLQTARTINGVSFNGSADITVTAAAGTLSGNTLNSGVTASSLTSVGTISTGVWEATDIGVAHGGTGTSTGSITGTGALTFTAGGTDTNVNLVPNGTGIVDVGGKRVGNAANPTQSSDLATKAYVDSLSNGLDVKASVRAATTANITLSNTQTVDGVALSVGDRVLVKNQSTGSQNGIYVVASSSWTRAADFDNSPDVEVSPGTFFFVEEGTTQADNGYVVSNDTAITIGTTAITFSQFSGAGQITAGAGLTKSGNTLDVVGTADRITVNTDSVDIASTYVGQSTITTLGTIGTGTWQGTVIGATYGGTGVNNGSSTITLGGSFTHTGAHTLGLTTTANTSVTLPTTGTLATLAGTESLSNKTITSSSFSGTTIAGSGAITFTSATDASAIGTAAVVLSGGLSVAKAMFIGTNITGAGAATSTLDGFQIDGGTY